MIEAIVFDAYGTLFDVASVDRAVAQITSDLSRFTALWRSKQLEYSFLRTLMDQYADFWQVTQDALSYTAARFAIDLTREQRDQLLDGWLHVAPFDDAAPTLTALAHFRRAILSNGTPAMLDAALSHAQLRQHFDAVVSVDQIGAFKPRPEVYALVQQSLGVAPAHTAFVSSNGWDAAGATAFGFQVYWINRGGLPTEQLGVSPTAILGSLAELPAALQPM